MNIPFPAQACAGRYRDPITGLEIDIPQDWLAPAMAMPSMQADEPQAAPGIPPWVLQGFTAGGLPVYGPPHVGVMVPHTAINPREVIVHMAGQPVPHTAINPPHVIVHMAGDLPPFVAPAPTNLPAIPGLNAPFPGGAPGLFQPAPVNPASPAGALIFPYEPQTGEKALASFDQGKGMVVLTANDLRQGLMTAMVHAEELGKKMGWSTLNPDGSPVVGSAQAKADPSTDAGKAYLAVFAAVNAAQAASGRTDDNAPVTLGQGTVTSGWLSGIAPAVIAAIVVVAAVAVGFGAWVLAVKMRSDADALARVKRAQICSDLIKDGKPCPPGLLAPEPPPAGPSGGPSLPSFGIGAGVGLAVAAAVGIGVVMMRK